MIKSLTKFSIACAFAVSMAGATGCAMPADDGAGEELGQTESALHSTYTLYGRATYDANIGAVMVDLATTPIPEIGDAPWTNPHTADRFLNVRVWLVNGESRRLISVLGGTSIGPGGGCIHFNVPATTGETLQIDSVVRLTSYGTPRAGRTAPITVQVGDWVNDPTVVLH